MINLTPIVRKYMHRLVSNQQKWSYDTENVQKEQLKMLVRTGRASRWGSQHILNSVHSYNDFIRQVPVCEYEDLREYVMRMISGRPNVLWPGKVVRFAQSSGTSGGPSKYIPVTEMSLKLNHYAGTRYAVANYLNNYGQSRLFAGKALILGGSYANTLELPDDVYVGDLSAHLIDCMPGMSEHFRVPSKDIALMSDWREKLPALIESSVRENVTNISGVPSWFLTVLKGVLEYTGATHIHQVWPELEVFFHGGISFKPYRDEYDRIIDPSRMRYLETYNASEGFFAVQNDVNDPAMLLLMDVGVFYEFLPLDQLGNPQATPVPAWDVEQGRTYALIITSCNGLWRYNLGDTIKIESINPIKITIAGRTKSYINVFGEELMVHNADAAIANACSRLGCTVVNYTAGPVYASATNKGRHEWWIEWGIPPRDIREFAAALDYFLQCENSDYRAKRQGNIFLDCLSIHTAPAGLFDFYLSQTGRLGGQRKVPRLCNDRHIISALERAVR